MAIRTVIFDLGKTLVPFDLQRLEPRLRCGREEAERLALLHEIGGIGVQEFQQRMGEVAGLRPDEVSPWWNSIFDDRWLIPPDWVRSLRRRFRVGVLSNTNPSHFEFLRPRLAALDLDFQILSFEVGAAKPAPTIYAAAERAGQCEPGEIRYLDDIQAFADAARQRGWRAELFSGWERLQTRPWVASTLDQAAMRVRTSAGSRVNTSELPS